MIDLLATNAAALPDRGMGIDRFGVNLVDAVVRDGRVVWRARA